MRLFRAGDPVREMHVIAKGRVKVTVAVPEGEERDEEGWVTVASSLKHEAIASMVSATRVSVTMAISELRERGPVEGKRGTYRFHMQALTSMTESLGDE